MMGNRQVMQGALFYEFSLERHIEPAYEVEQELAAGLGEGQIAEFVEDDEVHTGQMIGEPTLSSIAGLGLEPIDEIDHVVEPATGAGADAASGDAMARWVLPVPVPPTCRRAPSWPPIRRSCGRFYACRRSASWRATTRSPMRDGLQLPQSPLRAHYVKARVVVREYPDDTLAVFHGPRLLARYDATGEAEQLKAAA